MLLLRVPVHARTATERGGGEKVGLCRAARGGVTMDLEESLQEVRRKMMGSCG